MTSYEYDQNADCVYVRFDDAEHDHSEAVDDTRFVDYAADDTVIGIELLYVSGGVDVDGLPRAAELAAVLRANGVSVAGD